MLPVARKAPSVVVRPLVGSSAMTVGVLASGSGQPARGHPRRRYLRSPRSSSTGRAVPSTSPPPRRARRASSSARASAPTSTGWRTPSSVVDVLRRHGVDLVVDGRVGAPSSTSRSSTPSRTASSTRTPRCCRRSRGGMRCATPSSSASRSPAARCTSPRVDVDAGPILAQEAVPVLDGDTEATLHERIKEVERRLYVRHHPAILERGIVVR